MSELRSKCCGAKVEWRPDPINAYTQADSFAVHVWVCKKCSKPTEVEEKKEGGDKK